MKRWSLATILGIVLLPIIASADPPFGAAKKMMREIGLNDQQIGKIQELKYKADREQVDIRSDLDKAHLDMRQLLSADKPDQAAVFAQIEKIGALEVRHKKNRIGLMLEVRKLMTPVQWEKIEAIWIEEHGKGRHGFDRRDDELQPPPDSPAAPAAVNPAPATPKTK